MFEQQDTAGQDEFFMGRALEEARLAADQGEVPVGAVVTHNGRIIGRGHNGCERLQDATAHAEMIAITAASQTIGTWRLEECTLYVTLEPCPMCMGAALNSRIARVVYAAPEPKAGACGSIIDLSTLDGFNHQCTVTAGIGAERSSMLLKSFFKQLREEKKRVRKNKDL